MESNANIKYVYVLVRVYMYIIFDKLLVLSPCTCISTRSTGTTTIVSSRWLTCRTMLAAVLYMFIVQQESLITEYLYTTSESKLCFEAHSEQYMQQYTVGSAGEDGAMMDGATGFG